MGVSKDALQEVTGCQLQQSEAKVLQYLVIERQVSLIICEIVPGDGTASPMVTTMNLSCLAVHCIQARRRCELQ